jgi:hypothetical protein
VRVERFETPSCNIVGIIRGTDPVLRDEYVLYSSHQDHDGVRYLIGADYAGKNGLAKLIIDANSHSRNLGDIADHYNVSSDFFLLFLDERYHFYSCGDFRSPADTLEQAQVNKAEHFLSLLAPKPGDNFLELGCGWGAMMKFLRDKIDWAEEASNR